MYSVCNVLCVQDLKGKILVKGKKEHAVVECSSSSSDLSSSDEEASQAEGKPRRKKEDKKVCITPPSHVYPSRSVCSVRIAACLTNKC